MATAVIAPRSSSLLGNAHAMIVAGGQPTTADARPMPPVRRSYGGRLCGSTFVRRPVNDIDGFSEQEQRAILADIAADRAQKAEALRAKEEERRSREQLEEACKAQEEERQAVQREREQQEEEALQEKRREEMKQWLARKEKEARERKRRDEEAIQQIIAQEQKAQWERQKAEQERREECSRRHKSALRRQELEAQHYMQRQAEAEEEERWQAQYEDLVDGCVNHGEYDADDVEDWIAAAHEEARMIREQLRSRPSSASPACPALGDGTLRAPSRPASAIGLGSKPWRPAGSLRPKSACEIRMQRPGSATMMAKPARRAQSAGRVHSNAVREACPSEHGQPARGTRPPSAPELRTLAKKQVPKKARPTTAPLARTSTTSNNLPGYAKIMEKAFGAYMSQPLRGLR